MAVQQVGNQTIYSGNYATITINGVIIAAAKQWTMAYSTNLSPEGAVGTALPVDLVPGLASVTVTLSSLRLNTQSMVSVGIEPPDSLADIGQIPEFSVDGYDRLFGTHLKGASGCVFDSNTITIGANAATVESVTITGKDAYSVTPS